MDALSELLRTIRLSGTAFIDARMSAPWAIRTPTARQIANRLAPGAGRVILYHLVAEGSCIAQIPGRASITLEKGEVVVFPHGDVHLLSSSSNIKPQQITPELVVKLARPDAISKTKYGGDGEGTGLVCGFFACDRALSDHLVQSLPRMFKFRVRDDSAAALLPVAARQSGNASTPRQPGANAVLCKLSELLFVDAVRACIETLPEQSGGWIAGLKNRHVSRALALIHREPSKDWSIETLAGALGTSRSTLAEHFVRCMSQTPMQYLSAWRLRLAADALAGSDHAIKKIAGDAGFASTAAFSRAFKRELKVSPGEWRRTGRAGAVAQPSASI